MSPYPRVPVGFILTVASRGDEYVGQIIMELGANEERVVWESTPDETPTLAYQLAEDRMAGMFRSRPLG